MGAGKVRVLKSVLGAQPVWLRSVVDARAVEGNFLQPICLEINLNGQLGVPCVLDEPVRMATGALQLCLV